MIHDFVCTQAEKDAHLLRQMEQSIVNAAPALIAESGGPDDEPRPDYEEYWSTQFNSTAGRREWKSIQSTEGIATLAPAFVCHMRGIQQMMHPQKIKNKNGKWCPRYPPSFHQVRINQEFEARRLSLLDGRKVGYC